MNTRPEDHNIKITLNNDIHTIRFRRIVTIENHNRFFFYYYYFIIKLKTFHERMHFEYENKINRYY